MERVLKTAERSTSISPTDTSSTCCHLYFDLIVQSTQDIMQTEPPVLGGKKGNHKKGGDSRVQLMEAAPVFFVCR